MFLLFECESICFSIYDIAGHAANGGDTVLIGGMAISLKFVSAAQHAFSILTLHPTFHLFLTVIFTVFSSTTIVITINKNIKCKTNKQSLHQFITTRSVSTGFRYKKLHFYSRSKPLYILMQWQMYPVPQMLWHWDLAKGNGVGWSVGKVCIYVFIHMHMQGL